MKQFTQVTSMAAPLLLNNIDTDIISPMAALNGAKGDELIGALDKYAFSAIRYVDGDAEKQQPNFDFALNNPVYRDAKILIVGDNFGCGSSRETAPLGISALGISCIIGTTFGDIFFNNCFQCGILPIRVDKETLARFVGQCGEGEFKVDLENQIILTPSGENTYFETNEFKKTCLLKGFDDIEMSMDRLDEIRLFQKNDQENRPWIYL